MYALPYCHLDRDQQPALTSPNPLHIVFPKARPPGPPAAAVCLVDRIIGTVTSATYKLRPVSARSLNFLSSGAWGGMDGEWVWLVRVRSVCFVSLGRRLGWVGLG